MKLSAVAGVALAAAPSGEIRQWVTAGSKRWAQEAPLQWQPAAALSGAGIVLDPGRQFQEVLGFGAAFTDAACYVLSRLAPQAREALFREFFHPSELGLSVFRSCIGSSDYSASVYSYDEGEPDPEMRRFSIEHDRQYILPVIRQARAINPGLYLFSSPWSPPGWMKANNSMLGGSMRKSNFASYAKYFVKFLQDYAAEGVPVQAVSPQNEVDTDQDGKMPACLWGQEYEIEFVARHLGPQLALNKLDTRIWILVGRTRAEPLCGRRGVARLRRPAGSHDARARSLSQQARLLDRGRPGLHGSQLQNGLGQVVRDLRRDSEQLVALHHLLEPGPG
jgi:glucosylceramidase